MKKKIAVMSLCFTTLMYLVLTVSVADMLAAFPNTPADTVMLVLMLPNITAILGILLVPMLPASLSPKALSLIGLALLCLGGSMFLVFYTSLPALLAASCVMGLAYGVISTLYPLLVNTHFVGEERIAVMGWCAGALQAGRLISALIGGYLAKRHWYDVYWTFGLVVLAFVLVALFLPKGETRSQTGGRDVASLHSGRVWRLALLAAAFACLYFIISTDGSLYIEGNGLGDSALTGWLNSLACAVAGAASACYGRVNRLSGRFTMTAAFGVIGAGYLLAGQWVGIAGAIIAFCASALGIALFTPWLMTAIYDAACAQQAPIATAIVLTTVNVGYFVSPYVTAPLGRLLGGGSAASFSAAGIAALLFCVVTALLCRKKPLV